MTPVPIVRGNMRIRKATKNDITVMASHHRKMFEEIWKKKGQTLYADSAARLEAAYAEKLKADLTNDTCKAWVAETEETVVASGAITIIRLVPTPMDISCDAAYLHSMYTDGAFRNRRCAQNIIAEVIKYCQSRGIKRILLNASDDGKPVYEKIGFTIAPDFMRLTMEGGK